MQFIAFGRYNGPNMEIIRALFRYSLCIVTGNEWTEYRKILLPNAGRRQFGKRRIKSNKEMF